MTDVELFKKYGHRRKDGVIEVTREEFDEIKKEFHVRLRAHEWAPGPEITDRYPCTSLFECTLKLVDKTKPQTGG